MTRRQIVLIVLALVLVTAVLSLAASALRSGVITTGDDELQTVQSTNLALDIRFDYALGGLEPAPFDDRAEYPLRLDAPDWSFYGKRIQGLEPLLINEPSAMLFDFIGSQHVESFVEWFRLVPQGKPVYEDTYIKGELALHQRLVYQRTAASRGWPVYFPKSVTDSNAEIEPRSIKEIRSGKKIADRLAVQGGRDTAYVEGWAFFAAGDLFLFQAVSASQLTDEQRQTCLSIMESMEFDVLVDLGRAVPHEDSVEDAPTSDSPEPVELEPAVDAEPQTDPAAGS